MKKFISFLLALVILFSIAAPTVNIAYAVGDQNYTGGDYDLDYLNPEGSYWDETLQGIRISLFDCNTKKVTKTIDYSNHKAETLANYPLSYQDPATGEYISLTANVAENWYGYVDKLQYMKGKGLAKQVGKQYEPQQFRDGSGNILTFPNCITKEEKSNYAAVKKFFTDNGIARGLAKDFGVNFDILATTDRYKIILEPVVYFCWCNQWYAMTATEAAVFDKTYGPMNAVTVDGKSYSRMMKLTRGMVQLCMYLEKDDTVVGIAAYHGTQSEQEPTISIPKLGVGIISFAELLQASNKSKFKLTIIKEDSVTGARLAGAKFNIYDPLLKKTFKVTTDINGEASVYCALPNYYHQTYTAIEITETKAPEGYVLNPTKRVFKKMFFLLVMTLRNTYTIKNDPIIDQEDEPIDGDNIVWAYQLTESFTNDTNFNSRPSWRGAPTLHSCSKGYTPYSGTTDYYPNIPDDAYDISVKANDIYEDVPDGNGGTIEVYSHTEYDYSYKISHDSSCLVGIIWNGQPGGNGSTEVEIPASTYIAGSVFSDNSNMNEYKILHNGGNYMLQFEGFGGPRGITYSVPRYQDVFAELADTLKTWISHRNGGLTRQAQELPLASYMSSQNAAYKNFYSRYTGNTATERASNSSNPAFYGSTNNINTHTTHGGNLRRWYTGYYCNDGHSDGDPVVYDELYDKGTTTSNPRQTYRYAVEGSYKAQARSKDTSKTEVKEIFKNTGHTKKVYMMPSNQYSFYPTYEMTYTDTLGSHNTDTAYMLSAGRRTFRATDAISIETSGGETEVWAPWSRDWVDKYADESVYNYYEPERGYSVIKAGMVVKAVTSSPATVTLRAAFNVQDPAYAPEELRETVKAQNDAKAREMEQALKDVVADLQQRTAETYGYYSNLWEATSENLSTLSGGALDPQMPSWAYSESPKTRLNIAEYQAPSVQWHYTAYRGVGGTQRGTLNTLTINGHKYNNAARVSAMDTYMGTVDTVTALLDTARGTAGKQNVRAAARSSTTDGAYTNWYEEYYEGIRVCEITAKVELGAGQINTLYTQVHSQLSDDVTPMNEQAQNLLSYGYNNEPLFEDGMFGIGLCAVTDTVTVGSNSFERAFCYFPPFHFGVRGHLYDLAQRGFAHTIRL